MNWHLNNSILCLNHMHNSLGDLWIKVFITWKNALECILVLNFNSFQLQVIIVAFE